MWIQILVTIFVALVLLRMLSGVKSKRIRPGMAAVWSALWIAVLIVFWTPEVTSRLADFFGIGRGADLIIYVAILAMSYMLYRIFLRLEKIDKELTRISRAYALRDEEKNNRSSTDR